VRGLRRLGHRLFGGDVTPPARAYDDLLNHKLAVLANRIDRPERQAAVRLKGPSRWSCAARLGGRSSREAAARRMMTALIAFERAPVALLSRSRSPK
jgi:hypothetical protein